MGHSATSDVVPFHIWNFAQGLDDDHPFLGAEYWAEGESCEDEEEAASRNLDNLEVNGWKYSHCGLDASSFGKHMRLYGDVWLNGDHKVFIINESQYSNVGEYEMTVCANDRPSLEAFKKDFELKRKINDLDSVSQWG